MSPVAGAHPDTGEHSPRTIEAEQQLLLALGHRQALQTTSPNNQERNVQSLLQYSGQVNNLKFDHLRRGDTKDENMKKLGIVTGTQAARDNGITTVSEKVLGSGSATNPNLRLTQKEEEYVLS